VPELLRRGVPVDIVTDQTSAHDPLSYLPLGIEFDQWHAEAERDPATVKGAPHTTYRRRMDEVAAAKNPSALLSALLSVGLSALPAMPIPGGAQVVPRLAQELRVKSMADAGDFAADIVMGPLREMLSMFILTTGVQPETPAALDASSATPTAFAQGETVFTTAG